MPNAEPLVEMLCTGWKGRRQDIADEDDKNQSCPVDTQAEVMLSINGGLDEEWKKSYFAELHTRAYGFLYTCPYAMSITKQSDLHFGQSVKSSRRISRPSMTNALILWRKAAKSRRSAKAGTAFLEKKAIKSSLNAFAKRHSRNERDVLDYCQWLMESRREMNLDLLEEQEGEWMNTPAPVWEDQDDYLHLELSYPIPWQSDTFRIQGKFAKIDETVLFTLQIYSDTWEYLRGDTLEAIKLALKDCLVIDWEHIYWMTDVECEYLMSGLYPRIYRAENLLRRIINMRMPTLLGSAWLDTLCGTEETSSSDSGTIGKIADESDEKKIAKRGKWPSVRPEEFDGVDTILLSATIGNVRTAFIDKNNLFQAGGKQVSPWDFFQAAYPDHERRINPYIHESSTVYRAFEREVFDAFETGIFQHTGTQSQSKKAFQNFAVQAFREFVPNAFSALKKALDGTVQDDKIDEISENLRKHEAFQDYYSFKAYVMKQIPGDREARKKFAVQFDRAVFGPFLTSDGNETADIAVKAFDSEDDFAEFVTKAFERFDNAFYREYGDALEEAAIETYCAFEKFQSFRKKIQRFNQYRNQIAHNKLITRAKAQEVLLFLDELIPELSGMASNMENVVARESNDKDRLSKVDFWRSLLN